MKFSFYPAFQKADSPTKPRPIYITGSFRKSGTGYNYSVFKYPIGQSVAKKYWDAKNQKVKNVLDVPNKDLINAEILAFQKEANRFVSFVHGQNQVLTPTMLKDHFDTWKNRGRTADMVKELPTLLSFTKDFIKKSENRVNPQSNQIIKPRTLAKYRTTYKFLIDFADRRKTQLSFESLDLKFYDDFTAFLMSKNMTPNTIGKYLATVKTFLKTAKEDGVTNTTIHEHKAFKIPKSEGQHIYLNEADLKQLERLDLANNPRLERVRDLFLIGCWTGLRFSDFTDIKPENIKTETDKNGNEFKALHITQFKTGGKVVVPLIDTALGIIDKYKGVLPKAISNQKFNEYLKELAQLAEWVENIEIDETKGGKRQKRVVKKWEMVSSHTARRSFATNFYKRGVPAITLKQMTGHKTEAAFLKYIKVTAIEHAEIANPIFQNPSKGLKVVALAS
jgi:site-specific recombinase XerD